MEADFDKNKTRLEQRVDSIIAILSQTYPEQKTDAMGDYMKVLVMLKSFKDWRVQPIRDLINRLYIYPNREEHNELLTEVHDLKEELHEERINKTMTEKARAKVLGENPPAKKFDYKLILLAGLLFFVLLRKKS